MGRNTIMRVGERKAEIIDTILKNPTYLASSGLRQRAAYALRRMSLTDLSGLGLIVSCNTNDALLRRQLAECLAQAETALNRKSIDAEYEALLGFMELARKAK